ncbi:MAG: oligosaccharide flippase family protein, partial [Nitrospiria bacterium]
YTLGLAILRAIAIDLPGGQSSPVVRYVSIYHAVGDGPRVKGTIRVALKTTVIVSIISLTAFLLLSDFLAHQIYHQPPLSSVITPLAFSIPFVRLSSVLLGATLGMQIMTYRTVTRDLLEPAITLGVFLLLYLQGFKLQALIFAYLSSAIVVFAMSYYFFAKTFAHLFSSPFFPGGEGKEIKPISELKTMSRFALPLVIALIFTKLRRWGDILLLGFFMSVSQVGVYTIIYKTVNALSEISASLIAVFTPMIGPAYEKGALSTLKGQLQILSRWTFSLSFPMVLFVLFHAKPILSILGNQFIGGERSLIILLLGFLFEMTTAPMAQVLTMSGRSQITLVNTIGIGVLNVILFLILIPIYGIEGASLAVAVSMGVLGFARVLEGHAIIGIHPFTLGYLKPVIAGSASLLTTLLIDQALP